MLRVIKLSCAMAVVSCISVASHDATVDFSLNKVGDQITHTNAVPNPGNFADNYWVYVNTSLVVRTTIQVLSGEISNLFAQNIGDGGSSTTLVSILEPDSSPFYFQVTGLNGEGGGS